MKLHHEAEKSLYNQHKSHSLLMTHLKTLLGKSPKKALIQALFQLFKLSQSPQKCDSIT